MRKRTTPAPERNPDRTRGGCQNETTLSAGAGYPEPRVRLRRAAARRFPPGNPAPAGAITTGLMEELGSNGFQDIAEIEVTGHRVIAKNFGGGGGGGFGGFGAAPQAAPEPDLNIPMPQLRKFENDTWTQASFNTAASSYPMVVSASYGKGSFYAWAIPDDFADFYRLPASVVTQIRNLLGREMFVEPGRAGSRQPVCLRQPHFHCAKFPGAGCDRARLGDAGGAAQGLAER